MAEKYSLNLYDFIKHENLKLYQFGALFYIYVIFLFS